MSANESVAALERDRGAAPAPRFLPLMTISVRFIAPPHTDRGLVFGVISNMSETGACVITNRALPVDARARLEIRGRAGKTILEPLELTARVVWCAERFEPMKEIVGFLTGVCFDSGAVGSARRLLESEAFQSIP